VEPKLGDIVQLRKKHPCGSYEWQVVRLGADIGVKCRGCSRRVLLERHVFQRRVKAVLRAQGQDILPQASGKRVAETHPPGF